MAGSDQAQVHPVQSSKVLTPRLSGNSGAHDQLLQGWLSALSPEHLLPTAGLHRTVNAAMLQFGHDAGRKQAPDPDVQSTPGFVIV